MRSQILALTIIPMALLLVMILFFNQNSTDELLKANASLKAENDCLRMKQSLDILAAEEGFSDSARLDVIFSSCAQVAEARAFSNGERIYLYISKQPISRDENTELMTFSYCSCGVRTDFAVKTSSIRHGLISKVNLFINIVLAVLFLIVLYMSISSWYINAMETPLTQVLSAHEKLAKGEYDARIRPFSHKTSEIIRISGSFNNMAEELEKFKKELEEKNLNLESLNRKYMELNEKLEIDVSEKTKELREFFSLISHDLKVPLAAVQGYASLLMREKTGHLNEKQSKFLKSIAITNQHMTNLVRNLMDYFKHESGKAAYILQDFDIADIWEEIMTNISFTLEEKNLSLNTNISECGIRICADRTKISRAIINLLSNAIKISESGSQIDLLINEDKDKASISVRDYGKGIDKSKTEEIFRKFSQLPYGDRTQEGTGLGLYIVKKIIEGHNQTISVKSEEGKGTEFSFTLNLSKSEKI